eukprot:TRINITY_DN1478_c4_g1_i1.p1 TRINITY_DN1478_c4_g1~~TRINITY_DN1478_c4_g1_i1.p1  ORF type:complete len:395 (+),score=166.22 TRINITY_DN1478_c4_g1_i1:102-1286(+)
MGPKKKGGAAAKKKSVADDGAPPKEFLTEGYESGWDLRESTERQKVYKECKMGSREVYVSECTRLGKKANSKLLSELEGGAAGEYDLTELNLNGNLIGNVTPLLDLLRVNTGITKVLLKENGIQNSGVPLLCQVLVDHPSVAVLDLTGNKQVGYVAGKSLLMLLQRNENIHSCRIAKTGIPPATKEKIDAQALMNFNRYRLSRKEYMSVRTDFRQADVNGNGTVALSEMVQHEKHKLEVQLKLKHKKSGDAEKEKAAEKERQKQLKDSENKIKETAQKLFDKLDRDGDQKLTFPEFLRFYYSNIPEATLALFIEKYEREEKQGERGHLTEEQVIELFDRYDVDGDGGLTKQELLQGLSSHKEDIESVFREYDLDGGETLGLGEFLMFMMKRGAV